MEGGILGPRRPERRLLCARGLASRLLSGKRPPPHRSETRSRSRDTPGDRGGLRAPRGGASACSRFREGDRVLLLFVNALRRRREPHGLPPPDQPRLRACASCAAEFGIHAPQADEPQAPQLAPRAPPDQQAARRSNPIAEGLLLRAAENLSVILTWITRRRKGHALVVEEVFAKTYLLTAEGAHHESDTARVSLGAAFVVRIAIATLLPLAITVLGAKR